MNQKIKISFSLSLLLLITSCVGVVEQVESNKLTNLEAISDEIKEQKAGDEVTTDQSGSLVSGTNESGTNESGTNESGTNESGTNESGTNESGTNESGTNESGTTVPVVNNPPIITQTRSLPVAVSEKQGSSSLVTQYDQGGGNMLYIDSAIEFNYTSQSTLKLLSHRMNEQGVDITYTATDTVINLDFYRCDDNQHVSIPFQNYNDISYISIPSGIANPCKSESGSKLCFSYTNLLYNTTTDVKCLDFIYNQEKWSGTFDSFKVKPFNSTYNKNDHTPEIYWYNSGNQILYAKVVKPDGSDLINPSYNWERITSQGQVLSIDKIHWGENSRLKLKFKLKDKYGIYTYFESDDNVWSYISN